MNAAPPYHSALSKGQPQEAEPLTGKFQDGRGNICFTWDVNNREIPDQYRSCDLIYAEPSWPAGLKEFDQRAGVGSPSYAYYATSLGLIIRELAVPTIMMISKITLRHLPPPDFTTVVILNGNRADVGFWNGAFAAGESNLELIRNLASQYNRVGDFCCGYGTTGRLFIEAGRTCVLTDYNAVCCGFVAQNMESWGA